MFRGPPQIGSRPTSLGNGAIDRSIIKFKFDSVLYYLLKYEFFSFHLIQFSVLLKCRL
jgi:hypothetical protein